MTEEETGKIADMLLPVQRRVGPGTAKKLNKLGVYSVLDLLYFAPRRVQVWNQLTSLAGLSEGDQVTFIAEVVDAQVRTMRARRGAMLTVSLATEEGQLTATFFAKHSGALTYHRKNLSPGRRLMFAGKISEYRGKWQLAHPSYDDTAELSEADLEEKLSRPVPIYPATAGLPSWAIARAVDTVLSTLRPTEVLDIWPTGIDSTLPQQTTYEALQSLHHPESEADWITAKQRLAMDEALITQTALALARRGQQAQVAPSLAPVDAGVHEMLLKRLPWELTKAQKQVLSSIDEALAKTIPMQKLIQGDVGSGKTVVALLAMCRAVDAGYQAALLAPTEVLAAQHAQTLRALLGDLAQAGTLLAGENPGTRVELLTGSLKTVEKRKTLARMASGEPLIVVGTHALLSDTVQLPRLGLAVVDEQHRFGVAQRDALRERGLENPHVLVMTATPIPRTVAMTVFGDLDIEILDSRPQGRAAVKTFLVPADNPAWMARVWQRAAEEIADGGHVYVVCPRIDQDDDEGLNPVNESDGAPDPTTLASVTNTVALLRTVPELAEYRIGVLHGRMAPAEKEQAMADFTAGVTPLLVSTTVIEVGVDDPAATMMVVLDAQQFGLSQLHQLRGRIGRGKREGICMAVMRSTVSSASAERLQAFADTTDGFVLAEKDLELRAEGDVLGANQTGFHSGLRFLKVRYHQELISKARQVAFQIVNSDPQLISHAQLGKAIKMRLNDSELTNLLRS